MALKIYVLMTINLFSIFFPLANSIDFSYPAVFNFGDSNSDTGGLVAGVGERLDPPNGQIYFQKPSGRFCDGRLIIDFLSNLLLLFEINFLFVYFQTVRLCNIDNTSVFLVSIPLFTLFSLYRNYDFQSFISLIS